MKPIERDFIQGVMADAREQNERQEAATAFRDLAVRLAVDVVELEVGPLTLEERCAIKARIADSAREILKAAGAKP